MALIHPAALGLLGAVLIPVAIHLLVRRRGRAVSFPTLRFVPSSSARRLAPGRPTAPALLAARVALVALLAVLLAGPYRTGGAAARRAAERRERVVVVDRSESMAAEGAADRALDAARRSLGELGPEERASLVVYGGRARLASGPSASPESALAALAGLAETDVGTGSAHGAAAHQAVRALHGRPGRREVVWISDFRDPELDEVRRVVGAAGARFLALPVVSAAAPNDAPAAARLGSGELLVWVDRFTAQGARGEAARWLERDPAGTTWRGELGDGRGVHARLERRGAEATITVSLEPGDALGADDVARFRLAAGPAVPVAVHGPEPWFVRHALEAAARVDGLRVELVEDPLEARVVVVTDAAGLDALPARTAGAALIRGGAVRADGEGRRLAPAPPGGPLAHLLPVDVRDRGPLDAAPLPEPAGPGRVLARFTDGSVAAARPAAGRATVELAFALGGPPRGAGLEPWFPALVRALVLEVAPSAAPALSVRDAASRRESALGAPHVPAADEPGRAWVRPATLAGETGWGVPIALLLLGVGALEGLLAWRTAVRP